MARQGLALTDSAAIGLFFIQRYRFLTIDQFTRAAGMKRPAASEQLRELERHGILGHFGNIGMPGIGKTPKVYFLKRKGWELLTRRRRPSDEDQARRGNRHRQTLGDVRRPDNQGAGPSKLREPNGQKAPRLQLLSHVCSIVTAQKPENWVA